MTSTSTTLQGTTSTPTITRKEIIAMNSTACSVKGVLDSLRMQIQILDAEIKAEIKSKMEYERQLQKLQNRRDDLTTRINMNTEWVARYDIQVGPFADKYNTMTAEIGNIYTNAKKGHSSGIKLLEKEFGYHPLFKRPGDSFTACAFRPI